jgi:GrpB-like predicted nucleotidyltransferase (UPF0157 family)
MTSIVIADYSPAWPAMFEEERARILDVAGDHIDDIQHVGSTSVPGLGAKPIIDIMIGLRDLSYVEQFVQPLRQLGYGYLGEHGIPERHFFRKPDNGSWITRTHQIHMIVMGSDFWCRHLLFRDYLRLHPEDARRYYSLKKELAQQFGATENYTDAKTSFIEGIIAKAALDE